MGISGKYSPKKRPFRVPITAWVLILIAAASAVTGTVTAYLSASTDPVENTFSAAKDPMISIAETFDGSEKTDVAVNVGDPGYSVFVRAAVVVTWKSAENGSVLGKTPLATGEKAEYTITFNDTDWFQKDGFWYCVDPISSGSTPVLIKSCAPVDGKTPDGYHLNVEIIAQTIQALGTTDASGTPAVTDAWGINVVDGKLSPT